MSDHDFQFLILRKLQSEFLKGHSASEVFPVLKSLGTGEILQSLTTNDIEVYDWEQQILTLTLEASHGLRQSLEKLSSPPGEIMAVNRMKERLDWGNAMERALYRRCFAVKVRGAMAYGGIFLDAVSQVPIQFPVARVRLKEQQVQMSILPIHIPFVETDPILSSGSEPQLSITPEAKADAEQLDTANHRFSDWIRGIATCEIAHEFRKAIRNPEVRKMIETSGKLIH